MDLTGRRFGRLVVTGENPEAYRAPSGKVTPRWDCACDCGRRVTVLQNALIAAKGGTRSCGCARTESLRQTGAKRQAWRVCAVCGNAFPAPPSSDRTTCSRECSARRKSETHIGKGSQWSEETRAGFEKRIAENPERLDALRESARKATEAAKLSPNSGAFETNIHAKSWILKAPDNQIYEFDNLRNFIREHPDFFQNPRSAETALSACANGRSKGRAPSQYKGWQVIYCGKKESNIEKTR